jgi:ferredoxin--NADP+ reductase
VRDQASMSDIAAITDQTPDAVRVLSVQHWTDRLFSFEVERPASFRFRSGEFVMIGLLTEQGKPLLRAYSITTPFWDEKIGFYSIKVADGPLTSRLQHIKPDEFIIMKRKPTGTLVLDALTPASRLFLVSTGTGIAPFASIIRDPETYERFDEIYLLHGCRFADELSYGKSLVAEAKSDMLIGEQATAKLTHLPSTTREPSELTGRPTDLISSGELFDRLNIPALSVGSDRVMICGSMAMNQDMKAICEQAGFNEGANSQPAEFVLEKAFVG